MRRVWVRALSKEQKSLIAATCEDFITETLKPRFLPEEGSTEANGPVDIFGKWRGSKYSFVARYHSDFPETPGEEFDVAFARLDHLEEHLSETRFDVMWPRHTGQWWSLHSSVTLEDALRFIASDSRLQPIL